MYPFSIVVLLLITALSSSWVVHVPSFRSDNEQRSSVSEGFTSDNGWKINETWPQQMMRSLWEREPHTIVTSHVQRMIFRQGSGMSSSNSTYNGTLADDAVHLTPFDLINSSEVGPTFLSFYQGTFPTVDCHTDASRTREHRKKISYRLDFAYDGTQFAGWQRQKDAKLMTVQECVEDYLLQLTGEEKVDVRVAGRTDSGVHAVGQVGRVRLRQPLLHPAIHMNSLCIWSVSEVSSNFHPSFGSKSRSYIYMIDASALNDLLVQNSFEKVHLNSNGENKVLLRLLVERINHLLNPLVGEELDYLAFSYGRIKTENTLCRLSHACARLVHDNQYHLSDHPGSNVAVAIELTGNRFLRRMVRILVATVLQLALSPNLSNTTLLEIIQSLDRSQTAPPAPAAGLVFIGADC